MFGYDSRNSRRHRTSSWNASDLGARWVVKASSDSLPIVSVPIAADGLTVYLLTAQAGGTACYVRSINSKNVSQSDRARFFSCESLLQGTPAISADGALNVGVGAPAGFFTGMLPLGSNLRIFFNPSIASSVGTSPIIDDVGTLFFVTASSPNTVIALRPGGTVLWRQTLGCAICGIAGFTSIPLSSPALSARRGALYVAAQGNIWSLSAADGMPRWYYFLWDNAALPPLNTWVSASLSLSADEDVLYVACHNNYIVALDVRGLDGTALAHANTTQGPYPFGWTPGSAEFELWRFDMGRYQRNIAAGAFTSSPALQADRTIVVGGALGDVFAIWPNGTARWVFSTGVGVLSSPAVSADGTVFIGSSDGVFYVINGTSGALVWSRSTGGGPVLSSPSIGRGGVVFVSANSRLLAISSCTAGRDCVCSPGSANLGDGCELCPAGHFASGVGSTACSPCPVGTASALRGQSDPSACLPCPAGTSNPYTGQARCLPCLPGSYMNLQGTSSCLPCLPGTANAALAAASSDACVRCPAGSYAGFGASSCTLCPPGSFGSVEGAGSLAACAPCPAGSASSATGAASNASCVSCSRGYYSPAPGLTACISCPPGSYGSSSGAVQESQCVACPPGTYNPLPAGSSSRSCIPALAGHYVSTAGSTESTPCPIGSFSAFAGAASPSSCLPCAPGSFGAIEGLSSCSSCHRGSYSNATGATSASACVAAPPGSFTDSAGQSVPVACAAGFAANEYGSVACKPCPLGTFAAAPGSVLCAPCPPGQTTLAAGAYQCLVGVYACGPGLEPADATRVPLGPEDCAPIRCSPPLVPDSTGSCTPACPPGFFARDSGCAACPPGGHACLLSTTFFSDTAEWTSDLMGPPRASAASPSAAKRQLQVSASSGRACIECSVQMAVDIVTRSTTDVSSSAILGSPAAPASIPPSLLWAVAVGIALSTSIIAVILCVFSILHHSLCPHAGRVASTLLIGVDLFSTRHYIERDGDAITKNRTFLGGACSLVGVSIIAALSASLIVGHVADNTLTQAALLPVDGDALSRALSYPPASFKPPGWPLVPGISVLVIAQGHASGDCEVPPDTFMAGVTSGSPAALMSMSFGTNDTTHVSVLGCAG